MTKDVAEPVVSVREGAARVAPPALGLGALMAAWGALTHASAPGALAGMPDDRAAAFMLALRCGALTCGCALVLLCAKDAVRPRPLASGSRPAFLACALASAVLACGGLALAAAFPGEALPDAALFALGAAAGFGLALLAALWVDAVGREAPARLARVVVCALLASAALGLARLALPGGARAAWCAALAATSAACLLASQLRRGEEESANAPAPPPAARVSLAGRFSSLGRSLWWALAVVCAGAFLRGFSWCPAWSGMPDGGPVASVVQGAAGAACAALVLATSSRAHGDDALLRLRRVVVPVAVATFVITPYFSVDAFGEGHFLFVGGVRETALALFVASLLLALPVAARVADASHFLVAGLALAAGQACALAGAAAARLLGPAASAAPVLLFVAYLVAVVVTSAARSDAARRVQRMEDDVFEGFLRERCGELAGRHGLTPRERDILVNLGRGHGYTYIAERLGLSESTVRTHAKSIFRKLGVGSREELLDAIDGR